MNFEHLAEFANHGLTWVGFGTVIGLAAQAIMPGRDPGGTVATLLMAIAGTLMGCIFLRFFYPERYVLPISMEGFAVGVGGAVILLAFYKILAGYWFIEGEQTALRRTRRRRKIRTIIED
jgi:uncharacterized membrane protein YeaQ/YmgE (transglycosylase-associated protein family)